METFTLPGAVAITGYAPEASITFIGNKAELRALRDAIGCALELGEGATDALKHSTGSVIRFERRD